MVSISGYLSSDLSASEMPVNGCQSGFPLLSVGRLAWALGFGSLGLVFFCENPPRIPQLGVQ